MKILYIAYERGAAALAAHILHRTAQNVALTWAQTPGAGLRWLQANHDAAAVIVDVQAQSCASFIEQLRGLGLATPVVVVVGSARVEPALAALNSGADGYVAAGPALDADLPRVVEVAIDRQRRRGKRLAQALTELRAARDQAKVRLARAEEARQQAERSSATELAAAAARLADVQARHTASLAREARICTALQQRLFELETALRNADERRTSEAVAFADQIAKRHAEFTASLTHTAQSRDALAAELSVVTAAFDEAQQARRADATAAAEHLRRREAERDAALADAAAARTTFEGALAEAEAAHRDTRQRAEMDLAAANERQAAIEDLLTQEADRRAILDQTLAAAEAASQEVDRRHAEEMARAATRLADLQGRYDQQLTEAAEARQQADQRAAAALAAAAAREAELVERLTNESDARVALEGDLAGAHRESARGRRRSLHVVSAYRRRGREQKAAFEAQLTGVRAGADIQLRAKDEEIRQVRQEHETLRRLLGATQDQLQRLHSTADEERQVHEDARLASASELQRMSAEYDQLRQSFDALQAAFQTLEQIAGAHAAERARLESVVVDRESELSAQAERHRIAQQVGQDAFAELQERLRQAAEESSSETARLQRDIDALRRELDATRARAEALRGDAERVQDLQAQLELSQKGRRREFERAPYALCRCTPTGVITDVNHAFVTLLGRRRADELRNADFAATVFDSAGDVGWLLERTRAMRKTEIVETRWKTRDDRHLTVRLQASATNEGSVEIVVEDITALRALEERLRHAQRMEAVGRLASEVAVTCDGLLRSVTRGVHEWLATIDSDGLRRQGENLLTDVTRAASFLRPLGVFADEQARALEPVSVQRVLRDLAPVLKRVAGDQIELVLPMSSGSFDVDVEAERLEQVLVNVAGYAREWMPRGGQMKIDLATTTVGRRFVARYPNVRPGDHVLITVTELPRPGGFGEDSERNPRSSETPGIDLGGLLERMDSCGGHVWMEAQPAGTLVVKIHLPKPAATDATDTGRPDARSDHGGRLAKLRLASGAGARVPRHLRQVMRTSPIHR